ncbi:MAG: hypothetical protein HXS54_05605 [Theionarchaea archaeon]|nr:hypothetical protein [Theionarchaea archaeon]
MENHVNGKRKQKSSIRQRAVPWILGLALILLIFLFRAWYSPPAPPAKTVRVLFVGNSLTFSNDMPEMFAELAQSGGYDVKVDMSAQGGWTLSDHASSQLTLNKLDETWDFVILQEQSVIPCIAEERNEYMYPAVRTLYEKVHEKGGTVILFMTWGRRDGLPDAGYENFDDMQQQIYTGYMDIANELGVIVAPVGVAWQNGIKKDPQLPLWGMDGIHPSKEGSYLSACVFYTIIFGKSPEGLDNTGLSEEMAQVLQVIAAETVL